MSRPVASMGPRQKSLGNLFDGETADIDYECFNGAEAKKPRKFRNPQP